VCRQERLRFGLARGYVRFYSARDVRELMRGARIPADRVSLIDLGRDWVAVIRPA
jgi:hypothetical protein